MLHQKLTECHSCPQFAFEMPTHLQTLFSKLQKAQQKQRTFAFRVKVPSCHCNQYISKWATLTVTVLHSAHFSQFHYCVVRSLSVCRQGGAFQLQVTVATFQLPKQSQGVFSQYNRLQPNLHEQLVETFSNHSPTFCRIHTFPQQPVVTRVSLTAYQACMTGILAVS